MLTHTPEIPERHHHHQPSTLLAGRSLTRRDLLTASAAMAGAGLFGVSTPTLGQTPALRPTPDQAIGPFYPVLAPVDQDADLTTIAGAAGRALGQVLYLSGVVTNLRGEPVAGAVVEIWQANAVGRYTHPADDNPQPIDANFDGFARIRTDSDGSYRFKTIKPGAYPVGAVAGWTRPPHIHFDVKGRASRILTQMYFEGEALNEKDPYLQGSARKDALIAHYGAPSGQQEANALVAKWNIVLRSG